jgi:hypothetical protein
MAEPLEIRGILGTHFQKSDLPPAPNDLPGLLLMRCVSGSQAYGMATETSDVDIRGIFVPTLEYMLGFMKRVAQLEINKVKRRTDEPEVVVAYDSRTDEKIIEDVESIVQINPERKNVKKDTNKDNPPPEVVIYAIQKYMALACNANPNILELLFMPEDCLLEIHPLFKLLTDNRKLFLSRRARWTYAGYANSQVHRIDTHLRWLRHPPSSEPRRIDYGLPAGEKLISREQLGAFYVALGHIMHDIIEAMNEPELDDLYKTVVTIVQSEAFPGWEGIIQSRGLPDGALPYVQKLVGASDNFIAALQKEQAYYRAADEWKKYQNWKKNRNPTRAVLEAKFGYDTKHGSHVIRLMEQGYYLMKNGTLEVRLPHADKIRASRDGTWLDGTEATYEKLKAFADEREREMQALYKSDDCPLPKEPDRKALDELCIEIVCKANEVPWRNND